MDEYNNNQNNVSGGNDMPNGEYHFVPPRQNQPQNNTNQYSQPVNQGQYYQNNTRPNNGTYYTPNNANMYGRPVAPAPKPPKKKNKALKAVIIVAIVVVAVSIFGIVASVVGNKSYENFKESTTQSESSDSTKGGAKINDSKGDVATKDNNGNLTVAGVAKKTIDSCVLISVYSEQNSYYDFYNFGQSQDSGSDEQTLSGEGSGVIMSENGGTTYIMTAAHVISDGSTFKVTTNDGKTYDAKTCQEIKADKTATTNKPAAQKPATQKPAAQKAKVYTGGLNISHPQLNGNFRENGFLNSLKNLNREYTIETTSSGNVYKYENADGQKMEVRFDKAGKPTKVTTHNGHLGSVYDISYHANGQRKHMTHGALENASNVVWEDWSYNQNGVTTDYVKGARVRNKTWKDGQIYRESHAWNGGKQAVSKIPTQVLKGGSGVTFKEGSHLTWSRSGNNFVRKDSASGETWTFDKNGKLIKRQMENGDVKTYNAKGWNYIKKGY